jgi:tetratricopeptide (TPR) repeat protein
MGKKSKRNRGASRVQQNARVQQGAVTNTSATSDVVAAAASTAPAVVGNEIDPRRSSASSAGSIRIDPIDSLMQLVEKNDHEGILKLESKLVLRATAIEGTEPCKAGAIYFMVAKAFVNSGLSSLIKREKAIRYLERSFALSESENFLNECVRQLVPLYLHEGRHDEAFVTMKRLTVRIPQHELIDPDLILSVAKEFYQATWCASDEKMIEILTIFLGTINRSWDKEKRAKAYFLFGKGYTGLAEYEKADSFLHKALAITDDPENKVTVLCQMGEMSRYACNYDDALAALNQALEIISAESGGERNTSTESWSTHSALVHTALVHQYIGGILEDWGKRDLEALESFERALVIMKDEYPGDADKLATMYHGIGVAHARLGNWDEAIDYLKLAYRIFGTDPDRRMKSFYPALLCEEIGRVCLDQYFWDERVQSHYPNGQPKPLANRYNQYLSR